MSQPEVSVIIPNFNRHQAMERAADSVLSQTGVSFELLVVDDASDAPPSRLYRRLREAGQRVLVADRRQGPGPCRNWAAAEARGRYLSFLDSDDCWLPGKLAQQLQSLRESGLRIGQVEEIWYRHGVRVNPLKVHRMEAGDLFARSLRAVCVSPSSVMLERDLFLETGGFDPELFVCEDYDLWLRVAARQKFHLLDRPLVVKYGGHDDQLSKALPAMDRFRLRALAKGLRGGAYGERWPAAREEVLRKLAILEKGAAKRSLTEVLELCPRLRQAAEEHDWEQLGVWSAALLQLWPVTP
jgi:glycosyltransferase involved in cell wall biosynthesis